MVTRYVGPGGNDGASGLTWALRKLTLNGVEDTPVVAGDVVWVGPGVYREQLIVDVSGAGGNEIVYIGDVTGCNTDGVGGIVRITGSDNDQTAVRTYCVWGITKHYRIFRGFLTDLGSNYQWLLNNSCTHWTIEDCMIVPHSVQAINVSGDAQLDINILRCLFLPTKSGVYQITFSSAGIQDAAHTIRNCLLINGNGRGVQFDDVGGVNIRNCNFMGHGFAVRVTDSPPVGYTAVNINNCILDHCTTGLQAQALGEIVENYNTFYQAQTPRANVNIGANSQTYPPILRPPLLYAGHAQADGFRQPWWFGELSEWSQIAAITGTSEPTLDLHGMIRPPNAAQNSWGPFQWQGQVQETTTIHGGSLSMKLPDAGRWQIFVPCTNTQTTISVYVYREANYAGNLPQMLIKQGGQAVRTTTDVAAASQWNLLTDTFTPAACTSWLLVELVSRNTAAAGNYDVFFDDMAVT